jgi:hypothetical protein
MAKTGKVFTHLRETLKRHVMKLHCLLEGFKESEETTFPDLNKPFESQIIVCLSF